ncbi:YoaK family protein [Paenochrobactrum sp. BZR 588]|uniref:YoaK family protein n=1 Tax=Paenochrobactrum TaxID=999488 RepID=UPI0035BBE3F4
MSFNSRTIAGLLLTASAGFVDVIAFLQLGGFFASFMSGNTTQLGIGLMGHPNSTGQVMVWFPAALIILFFTGAFLGTLMMSVFVHNGNIFVLMGVLILIGVVIALKQADMVYLQPTLLLAAAMGMQNASLQQRGTAKLGATYVTGTLFSCAADLARAITGEVPKGRWLEHFYVWLALMLGAISGGFADFWLGLMALSIPFLIISAVLIFRLLKLFKD